MSSASPAISLELLAVSKSYNEHRVFSEVSAALSLGDVLVVAGKNGSGKSTLLRIIAGLMRPSAGRVSLRRDGRELDATERRRAIGMLAPGVECYAELSAAENLEFFARVRGIAITGAEARERLLDTGLEAGSLDKPVAAFSSGMKQRLKLALALLHAPEILILDEPRSGLDVAGIARYEAALAAQRVRGVTVLATNDGRDESHATSLVRLGA